MQWKPQERSQVATVKLLRIILILLLLAVPVKTFAYSSIGYYTPSQLINKASELDRVEVTLRGEVVGECIERGEHCWINVYERNDETNTYIAIGVWIPLELTKKIDKWGSNAYKGDIIEIKGTLYRADPTADGELDVHAVSLKIIENGVQTPEKIEKWKFIVSVILGCAAIALGLEWFANKNRITKRVKEDSQLEDLVMDVLD